MAESKLLKAELIKAKPIDDPEEAFRKIMEMWPKKPLMRKEPSFRDLPPEAQVYLEEQYQKIHGNKPRI